MIKEIDQELARLWKSSKPVKSPKKAVKVEEKKPKKRDAKAEEKAKAKELKVAD